MLFLDGPAAGETLQLRRVPKLLRVVQGRGGAWDALDQLDDEPKKSESIHVYRRRDDMGISKYHVCIRGKGRAASGTYFTVSYSWLPEQPSDYHLRRTAFWQAWVTAYLESCQLKLFESEGSKS